MTGRMSELSPSDPRLSTALAVALYGNQDHDFT